MERKERIEQEVKKTLEGFDAFKTIEPSPFFYTRLQAKIRTLEAQKEAKNSGFFGLKALRPALVVLMLIFNVLSVGTALTLFRENVSQTDDRDQYLTAVVEEYALNQNDYYLYLANE